MSAADPPPSNPLLDGPIAPRLARLAVPNLAAMVISSFVTLAETSFIGNLGTASLAGMALAFPMVMLQGMLSAGAMGGGVSSAVSRALGTGDAARANRIAFHAMVIGATGGVFFSLLFLIFGPTIYGLLGGRGDALNEALAYSNVVFLAVTAIWLNNTFASVMRGTGNMRVPSTILIAIALLQVLIAGSFGLGWGPFPRWGMSGVALGIAIANVLGLLVFVRMLTSGQMPVRLRGVRVQRVLFFDILKVGGFSLLGPVQSITTILLMTALMSRQGTEVLAGFGIGIRMEMLLIPITFAIGVAAVPMVGMAIGAGQIERARSVAWTGARGAALILGLLGMVACFTSRHIAQIFSHDPQVLAAASSYFTWAGPCYGFFGVAHCLYFASQGSGRMIGPVLAGTTRLLVVALGGWLLLAIGAPTWSFFLLLSVSMVMYGVAACVAMRVTSWAPRRPRASAH